MSPNIPNPVISIIQTQSFQTVQCRPNFETYSIWLATAASEHERAIKMPPTARNLCAGLPPRDVIARRFHGENAGRNLIRAIHIFTTFQIGSQVDTFSPPLAPMTFSDRIEVCGRDGGLLDGARWHWQRCGWHRHLACSGPPALSLSGSLAARARRMLS